MKKICLILVLGITAISFGQGAIMTTTENPELQKWAKKLTQMYSEELVMQEKQRLLFKNKLMEFKIKDEKIRNSSISTKEKIANIQYNYQQETKDMADILTRPQLELYKKLKAQYQPMEAVVVGQVEE